MSTDMGNQILSKAAGVNARDVMQGHSLAPDKSEDHMFATGKLKGAWQKTDPFYGKNLSFSEGTQQKTAFQAISPNKSYKTDKINTQAMSRSAQSPVKDGGKMQANAATAAKDIKSTMAVAKADMKQAQAEQADATKQAAPDNDLSVSNAQDELSPQKGADKIAASAFIVADAMIGGGTLATMGKAMFVSQGVSQQDKKLTPNELKALAADSLARAASSGGNETAVDSNAGATIRLDVGAKSKFAFGEMSTEDYIMVAQTDVEKTPEIMALGNDLAAVKKVQATLGRLEDRKDVAFDLSDEKIDSISVELTGQGLQGISSYKMDTLAANDAANEAVFSSVQDMPKINADEDIAVFKPSTMALAQMSVA
ncbi:MAG: hypothetical protein COB14_00080 [Alphaproteobacteria bacterium]|nr:MAG: hypothetical protein COB14_00080 [Alphaproteobacteria bacterium]